MSNLVVGNIEAASSGRLSLGKTFGSWTVDSFVDGTDYLAATDLFVCAYISVGNQTAFAIDGYTDSAASPTTLLVRDAANYRADGGNTTFVTYGSISFPVKKGDSWRVESHVISAASGPTDLVINTMAFGA